MGRGSSLGQASDAERPKASNAANHGKTPSKIGCTPAIIGNPAKCLILRSRKTGGSPCQVLQHHAGRAIRFYRTLDKRYPVFQLQLANQVRYVTGLFQLDFTLLY